LKILVIGSEGFIGSHLVSYFTGLGREVYGCDLTEYHGTGYTYYKLSVLSPDFDTVLNAAAYDCVVNASGSGNVGFSVQQPYSDFEANSLVVARVLDSLRKHAPATRFIQISSAAVYGNPASLPVRENAVLQPLSPYGYHKLISEQLCREYHQVYGIPVAVLRPFSVYGNGLMKQLLWDICRQLEKRNEISLFGTGEESRDFIHISDLTKAVESVICGSAFEMDLYNVAAGNEVTVRTVATLLTQHYGSAHTPRFTGEVKAGDPLHWKADISRLQALGFVPQTRLEQGIEAYVHWFKNLPAVINRKP
jgi:nucleoside-diphosphate-sugar epimerase